VLVASILRHITHHVSKMQNSATHINIQCQQNAEQCDQHKHSISNMQNSTTNTRTHRVSKSPTFNITGSGAELLVGLKRVLKKTRKIVSH